MLTNTVLDEQTTIISASPGIDGTPPQWPGTLMVTDPRLAREMVKAQVEVRRIDGMVLGGAWRPGAR
jgi:hypothetical protein